MGKRLIRIRATDLPDHLEQLPGTVLDVVRTDGRTVHGRVLSVEPAAFSLRDHIGHLHTIPFESVEELVFDQVAPY